VERKNTNVNVGDGMEDEEMLDPVAVWYW